MPLVTPTTLRPSPWKWLGVGLISLAFTLAGAQMVGSGDPKGWLGLVFFGAGVVISVVCVLPNASYLKLDADGFTVRSLYRAQTVRWADVAEIGVGRVFLNKMVMLNFEPTFTRVAGLRSLNAGLTGFEGGVPDSYGLKHEELAELMNEFWRAARGR